MSGQSLPASRAAVPGQCLSRAAATRTCVLITQLYFLSDAFVVTLTAKETYSNHASTNLGNNIKCCKLIQLLI